MKTLYLIRHAKSDWSSGDTSDFERGINQRWEASIEILSHFLQEKNIFPDLIISSPAKRAKLTVKGLVEKISYNKSDIEYLDIIYDTHMQGYEWFLSALMQQNNSMKSILAVGHNYAISELASCLSWQDIWSMKTCSIIALRFWVENWDDISYGNAEVVFCETPKSIREKK